MIRFFPMPIVLRSSTIWSAIQGSSAALLLFNAKAQTESHIVSFSTKAVRLTVASSFSVCSSVLWLAFSLNNK